jgi:putative phosphoesterase
MIIALISDIHGNLPALKAVLKDAGNANVKQIWCLGDLVGYIPFPNECIELIRKKASASIAGNYDLKVIDFEHKESEWKKSKKQAKLDAFEWNSRHLNPRSRKYLRSLPRNIRRKIGKFKILLTHGSPQSIDEPVLPQTHQERLLELGKTAKADVILMGHTHRFMNRKVGNKWFINPGSVGLPVMSDLRASYALLEVSKDKIEVTEKKIQYDVSKVVDGLQGANLSGTLRKMIRLEYGIDLENYLKPHSKTDKTPASGPQRNLKAVRQLAGECNYEKQHSEHVTSLALNLFDELQPLHKLTTNDRFLLNCAGILHDIGWIEGQKGHHKTAMKLILDSTTLPFPEDQRSMIALIARYHRKALPKDSHPLFSRLSDKDKQKTRILAGILRIADGLDRTHTSAIRSVKCDVNKNYILVRYRASCPSDLDIEAAAEKSDLLKQALGRNIRFIII